MATKFNKSKITSFQQDLNDLLEKHDLLPEDGKLHLLTTKLNFMTENASNCKPECRMTKVVTLSNGHTTIMTFCDPDC